MALLFNLSYIGLITHEYQTHVFMNMVNSQNDSLSYKYPTCEHMLVYVNMRAHTVSEA